MPLDELAEPGFEGLVDTEIPPDELGDPIGPDDWYSIDPGDGPSSSGQGVDDSGAMSADTLDAFTTQRNRVIAGILVVLLLAGALGFVFWRRRQASDTEEVEEGPSLARGVSRVIDRQMSTSVQDIAEGREDEVASSVAGPTVATEQEAEPSAEPEIEQPASPAPEPIAVPMADRDPARIDPNLDIIGATRSLMMLTLEFRLELANRSDRAVRDIAIAGKLSSAQRGETNAAPLASGQPLAEIARIGPHQSRSITAQLQLPFAQVRPILQGNKPLLIPLLHFTIEGKGCPAMTCSYVVGSPSLTGSGRVHPLPFDGPPGSLSGLRSQVISSSQTDVATETI